MCGRFTITSDRVEIILKKFAAEASADFEGYRPRYNAAPGQPVPALTAAEVKSRLLLNVFWGFVAPWGEKTPGGEEGMTYQANIRDDTIRRNKFFHERLLTGRCAFVADGFYEWKKPPGYEHLARGERLPKGVKKIPYRVRLKDTEPFVMAGLWRTVSLEGKPLLTAGIITTRPNRMMSAIHERMPVILSPGDLEAWLDPSFRDFEPLHALLDPYPDGLMEAYVVSTVVNNSRNDTPACIEPAA
jgi:putative SOS response-associated peptidase YedK